MPKIAQEYVVLKTSDLEEARKLIAFDVLRLPAFCELEGQKIAIPKESIFRKEGLVHYETISPGYGLITHADAFDAMNKALEGQHFDLIEVSLERNGAEMTARFRMDLTIEKTQPELILLNSYNSATSLSLKLGSYHLGWEHSALVPSGLKSRWMHLGNQADPAQICDSLEESIAHYAKVVMPLYRRLASYEVTQENSALIRTAIDKNVIPKKMGKQVLHLITETPNENLWQVFNSLLVPINRCEATPSHRLFMMKKIADWIENYL